MFELVCLGTAITLALMLKKARQKAKKLEDLLGKEQDRAGKARCDAAGMRQEAIYYEGKLQELQTAYTGKAQQVKALQAALREKEDLLDEARMAVAATEDRLREQTKARLATEQTLEDMRGDMEQERRHLEHEKAVVTDMLRILDYTGGPTT